MTHATYVFGLMGALLLLLLVVELLRRRHLRGKYAVLWLALGLLSLAFAAVPALLETLSRLAGIQTPVNLLFFAAILTMLGVIMQLSYESGVTEDETRVLAEEVALLRLDLEQLRDQVSQSERPGS